MGDGPRAPQEQRFQADPSLSEQGAGIVDEELGILERIQARLTREAAKGVEAIEDLDGQLIELRDAIAEAKEEDVASLVDQMHQVAALSRKRGQGRDLPIDPNNPYFGHLRVKEATRGRVRDVLIGKRTLLDDGDGLSIVDWRNAPVSRLYYRYDEEDEYEEEFDDRSIEGTVEIRRSVVVHEGALRRIASPQGHYALTRSGSWREETGSARPTLEGGAGKASRVERNKLGVHDEADISRSDKHLQEITALIDREQFTLITQPESGIVLIQGGAGSGKTTVALHRVAYLAFQDPRRFAPQKIVVIVFNEALVEYIKHVLPSLGVQGVTVTTYRRWTLSLLRRIKLDVPPKRTDATPESVSRFKKHPLILQMVEQLVAEQLADVEASLRRRLEGRDGLEAVLATWRQFEHLPPVMRVERARDAVRELRVPPRTRAAAETTLSAAADSMGDVVEDWMELLGDGQRVRTTIRELAEDAFSDTEVASIVQWCGRKASAVADSRENAGADSRDDRGDGEGRQERRVPPPLDGEDDAILLRLMQVKYGGLFVGQRRFEYEHIVIDEAQDLCPLEVRVLLDCASKGHSVTIAGDKAQKMIFDNGFVDWPQLLDDAGLPHVAIQPLKITYRSTRQVMQLARFALGPLADDNEDVIARNGAPVSYHAFGAIGEAVAFLAEALRNLMQREPSASVALISRYPQQAEVYYEALRIAEVPKLRLVARQDFRFAPGIDVTDVRQVKGLEFDYVVILDPSTQNYPEQTSSRHLLHIAMTRCAYQLWLVNAGTPSALLPPALIEAGMLDAEPDTPPAGDAD